MKRTWINLMILASVFVSPALVGCDRTVSEEKTTEQKSNGETKTEEKKTVEKPDGTIEKTDTKHVEK